MGFACKVGITRRFRCQQTARCWPTSLTPCNRGYGQTCVPKTNKKSKLLPFKSRGHIHSADCWPRLCDSTSPLIEPNPPSKHAYFQKKPRGTVARSERGGPCTCARRRRRASASIRARGVHDPRPQHLDVRCFTAFGRRGRQR